MNTALRFCFVVAPILVVALLGTACYASPESESASTHALMEAPGTYEESPMLSRLVAAAELPR